MVLHIILFDELTSCASSYIRMQIKKNIEKKNLIEELWITQGNILGTQETGRF